VQRAQHTITVMGSWQAVRAIIRCISGAVVQRNVMDVDTCTTADTEAMYRVVLDIDVMNRARSEDFADLNEVIRSVMVRGCSRSWAVFIGLLSNTTIATKAIPP
jgi:hypothetical protein